MRILKFALIAVGILVILIGAGVAYIASTFDPNDYKDEIIAAVKEQTGRQLKLEGDISLSFFPGIGAKLGKASLSERGSDRQFATVDDVTVVVKLMPLLSKEVVVDAVVVDGLQVALVRHKDGTTNFDDLTGGTPPSKGKGGKAGSEPGTPLVIDIDHISVEDSAVTYTDQQNGAQYALSAFNLETGRIASGVQTNVKMSAVVKSSEPKVDAKITAQAGARYDAASGGITLKGLNISAGGAAAGVEDLSFLVKGDADVRPAEGAFSIAGLNISVTGKPKAGAIDIKLAVPQLTVSKKAVNGKNIVLDATVNDARGKLAANVQIPAIEGDGRAFKAQTLAAKIDLKQQGSSLSGQVSTPITGSIEAKQIALPKLAASFKFGDPQVLKNPLQAQLNGALDANWGKENASMKFTAKVDESNIKGSAGLTKFSPASYTFDVAIDKFDADRYLAKGGEGGNQAQGKPGPKAEQPFDLSALRDLNARGRLAIGSLTVSQVKASNVKLELKAAKGRLDVNPVSANLYEGSLTGELAVDAKEVPVLSTKQKLTGVTIGPLLKDLANNDSLEGKAAVTLDVTARGNTVSALKKSLDGAAAAHVRDGAIKGINIAQAIREAKAKLGALRGEEVQAATDSTKKTDFSALDATFKIKDGVAHNQDLTMKSPLLRVGGAGSIDIGAGKIDYQVKATLVGTTKGQGGRGVDELAGLTVPVKVSGDLTSPSYRLDLASVVSGTVKEKVGEAVRERLGKELGGIVPGGAKGSEEGAAKSSGKGSDKGAKDGSKKEIVPDVLKGLFGR